MATISIHNGKATLANNKNYQKYWTKDRDLSSFNWYVQKNSQKKYLATYLTPKNVKKIAKQSKLFSLNSHGTLFPSIKGFLMGNPDDKWLVVRVDQRNLKRLMSVSLLHNEFFENNYSKI